MSEAAPEAPAPAAVLQWWVSRRVTGVTPIGAAELIRIADALDVPVTRFLVPLERVAA